MNKLTLILAGLLIISTALLLQKEDIEILNADSQSIALADNTITIENNFKVTWYDCIHDIIDHSCKIDIQNLLTTPNNGRNFNLSAVISDTNYNIQNFNSTTTISEWKAILTEVPTYTTVQHDDIWYNITYGTPNTTIISNITMHNIYNTTEINGSIIKNIAQWKPTKSNMLKEGASLKMYYGSINIPKYESGIKTDDLGTKETINGTKTFKIEWKTPINKLNDGGYGSSGKVAFWDEYSQTEYHPWWNTSWSYIRPITITNSSVLSDYQVLVNITNTTNMNITGQDLRFTYNDNTTTLSYWIENFTTNNAQVWVRTNQSIINMWYGNPNAASASNGVNTFDFFDDFNETTLDTSKWVLNGAGGVTATVSNGILIITSSATGQVGVLSRDYIIGDGIIEARQSPSSGGDYAEAGLFARTSANTAVLSTAGNQAYIQINYASAENSIIVGGTIKVNTATAPTPNTYYYNKYVLSGTNLTGNRYTDGNWGSLLATVTYNDSGGRTTGYVGMGTGTGSRVQKVDWFRTRKYVATEPTLSIGAEQTQASDTTPPNITITSPTNITYGASVWFNITGSEALSSAWFSLDGTANITMTNSSGNWNYQNTSMSNGAHNVRFFANDTSGNLNASANNNVSFTVGWTFKGIVKDKNLNTVSGAIVYVIYQPTNATVGTAITNSTGGWNYTVNTLGNYTIAAENRNNISQGGGINPHIVVS